MKFKLKEWATKKMDSRRKGHQKPPVERFEGLPVLPSTRPRALTPSPSSENLALEQASRFFREFPRELRWQILTLAFGNRAVHMDLSFVHPVAVWRNGDLPIVAHAGLHADTWQEPPAVKWDTSVPKSWQWWGCVCHRPPPEHLKSLTDRLYQVEPGPGADACRFGAPHNCKNWPGIYPLKCKIGAMGWLLSCRQALVIPIEQCIRFVRTSV